MSDFYPEDLPVPQDFERHVERDFAFAKIERHINYRLLYNVQLSIRGNIDKLAQDGDPAFLKLQEIVLHLLERARGGLFRPACVWQFFRAQSDGDALNIFDRNGKTVDTFVFPRQRDEERLCLADFAAPVSGGRMDSIAMFACTCGADFVKESARLRGAGKLAESHVLNVLATTCAEAFAETLHAQLRLHWGFGELRENIPARLAGNYRGKRYSFGYPACPALEDQAKLFKLLRPEEIGLRLTENFMMEPEASVSAMVFHNPKAKLFSVK
jgi:5-methyltetrahydrofolate--homocysteine methyltransferase